MPTTLIQDTVYHADGTYATGTLLVSWPAFTTATGEAIPAGNTSVQIGANGAVSLGLAPNIGATPSGTYYTVVYHLDDGSVSKEYWVVPSTAKTTITAMRSEVMPASIAVQSVGQAYVLSELGNYLPLSGGALQGALLLNSDPQSALQAATKEYVDGSVQGLNNTLSSSLGQKVAFAPSGGQAIRQPGGTTLAVNNLNGEYLASQYQTGAGNNGIANAVAAGCSGTGCTVLVDPTYADVEGFARRGLLWPMQTSVDDYRDGIFKVTSHDPASLIANTAQGFRVRADFDRSINSYYATAGGNADPQGALHITSNFYHGFDNTENTFGGIPMFEYGGIEDGFMNVVNRWDSGQTFGEWGALNCHGAGDCIYNFVQIAADGGVNRRDDEGVHYADISVGEDPNVFTGTISGTVTTGATTVPTSCQYGCGTQGQDRLLIDTNPSKVITGTFSVSLVQSVNHVPPSVSDPNANYPVSTMVSLCYAGDDNGVGGAAGCPSGSAPSGYIPPQQSSPSEEAPLPSITTSVLPLWSGQPSTFCTPSNLQSSDPAGACYMPTSGVGCLVDEEEYETVNYTYNASTQQVTLLNLRFAHQNGMVFATGGLCGYAVEVAASIYKGGTGGNGVQSQVYPVEGSASPTTLYVVPQRTNEGYGTSTIGGGLRGDDGEFSISLSASNFTLLPDGKTVTFTVSLPNNYQVYYMHHLPVTITTANPAYNGTYPITFVDWSGGWVFSYQPTAPSGTVPTTGTVSYSNQQYTLFPSARTISVYDTATNSVDGNFYLMPNTVQWAQGDPVRQPHYQQMNVTGWGNPSVVTRFMPEQYISDGGGGITYNGLNTGGNGNGFNINNTTASGLYYGHGGTHSAPGSAYSTSGVWTTDFGIGDAPENGVISVYNCKADIGCNDSNFSNFNVLSMPNGGALNWDPNTKVWTFGNGNNGNPVNLWNLPTPNILFTSFNGWPSVTASTGPLNAPIANGGFNGQWYAFSTPGTSTIDTSLNRGGVADSVNCGKGGGDTSCTFNAGTVNASTVNAGGTVNTPATPAPLNIVKTGAQGQILPMVNLMNLEGNGGTGTSIDFFSYDGGNGLPGIRVAAADDATYSGYFTVFAKQDGNGGNNSLLPAMTVEGAGNAVPTATGTGQMQVGTVVASNSVMAPTVNATASLTVGGGSTVGKVVYYATAPITPAVVAAQSCSDQTYTISGLTAADNLGSIRPPGALGNVSVSGYASAANTLDLHFCNPSAASVTPPAGVYGFLAMH
ncbi:MAG: hypothetical protein ACP5EP_03710 [Acidobacteriaceae bacterium]